MYVLNFCLQQRIHIAFENFWNFDFFQCLVAVSQNIVCTQDERLFVSKSDKKQKKATKVLQHMKKGQSCYLIPIELDKMKKGPAGLPWMLPIELGGPVVGHHCT